VSHAQKVIAGVGTDLAKLGDGGYDKGARARQIHDDLLRLRAPTQKDMLEIQLDDRAVFLERWHNQLPEIMAARFPHLSALLVLLLPMLGVANICQARIGDTLQEAIERYGKVVKKASADEFAMFKEASYYITAHFHDDKTDAITYVKTGSEPSTKGAFSDEEIELLLKINGNGQTWERTKAKAGLCEWKTEDKRLRAVYSESKFLVITTAGYLKRLEEAAEEKKTVAEESKPKKSPTSKENGTAKRRSTPGARKRSPASEERGDK